MKKLALVFGLAFAALTFVNAQTATKTPAPAQAQASKAKLEFEETQHDFGTITQGDQVTYTFKFKNTGTEPLILSNVMTTCGCTATSWPREPIAPGATSEIQAKFNSAGKMGKQNKVITVVSNDSTGNKRVAIVSNVVPKPAPKAVPAGAGNN